MLCASALADSLVTNGGVSLNAASLPYNTEDASAPVVYYLSDISPEALVKALYQIHVPEDFVSGLFGKTTASAC